jgi:hypothetical protein
MDYQITHIIPDSADPDRRIDAVYGPTCGLLYEDTAIRNIDWGISSYYTMAYGLYRADVYAVTNAYGTRFLTTSPDGIGINNLCQLPRYNG